MKVMIVGQKWLGAEALALCRRLGFEITAVAAPDLGDRLFEAAAESNTPVTIVPKRLDGSHVPEGTDVIVCAHAHCFITNAARKASRWGAIGYHPSLLPRHRGKDAIRWAVHMREPVTGGTVYWMTDKADAGPIAAQEWCHIRPDDNAAALWKRELAPRGLRLLETVLKDIAAGRVTAIEQDESLATWEPSFERDPLSNAV